jgi:hypothetical protein
MQQLSEAEVQFLDAVLVHHPGRVGCPAEGRDCVHETAARLVEDGWISREEITREDEDWISYRFSEKMVATFRSRVEAIRDRAAKAAEEN